MNNKKISLIATILNEEENIKDFLESLINQTKKPDEIIIVDGGSEDKSFEILKKYSKKYKFLKVFQKKGFNISQGRNYAIRKSRNEIIIGGDAGTFYKKDWIEKLSEGFNGEVSFGKTIPIGKNDFQKVLIKEIKQRFGSSRNIIFKKNIWKKVGKYPEDLDIGEDSLFNEKIKKNGFSIKDIPDAIAYWEVRKKLDEFRKQFFNYGYWDGISYRKYKLLSVKTKIGIIFLAFLIIFYPILFVFSKISLRLKIKITKRFEYLKGFIKGFCGVSK
jgi:glycosyltransferase involved in cell wall biosynthesis